eukprot:COSAG01_NODE_14968_length_1390_cov_2.336174_2_plen_221_part_00
MSSTLVGSGGGAGDVAGAAGADAAAAAAAVPLHDAAALASAQREGADHLAHLQALGVMGTERPVKITCSSLDADVPAGAETKVVHLIRHGQGFHNLLADIYRTHGVSFDSSGMDTTENNPYRRPELVDPPLTAIGRRQASALAPRTRSLAPELVVVSPMVRATQTALRALPHLAARLGQPGAVPFVAHGDAREPGGVHTCDKRAQKRPPRSTAKHATPPN